MKKVILISIDGMRPDGLKQCGNPYVKELEKMCSYTYKASSVLPSATLPCHYSMTHSVPPERHGIFYNTYIPPVRPIKGLFEHLKENGKTTAMFYGWDTLRDISSPESLLVATYINSRCRESVDTLLTDEAIRVIKDYNPDFAFLYMVDTDEKGGHDNGWMSEEYLRRISIAIDNTKRVIETFGNEYSIIIMADHGGHDRRHGTDLPEDMTIPFFFYGPDFAENTVIKEKASLLDIAPTIVSVMGIESDVDWEGRSLITNI